MEIPQPFSHEGEGLLEGDRSGQDKSPGHHMSIRKI